MGDSYQVSIKNSLQEKPAAVEAIIINSGEQQQTEPVDNRAEPLSIEGVERGEDVKRWKPYENSKYESPVLNRLVPWPLYYYCRWKTLEIFHTRLVFGIVLGEVLFFLLLVGGLAGTLAASGMQKGEDAAEGTGSIAIIPALSSGFRFCLQKFCVGSLHRLAI